MPVSGALEHLLEYWQSLPRGAGQIIPAKATLTPSEIHEILPRIALLKRNDRYDIPIRMMGTSTNNSWHSPHIGMNAFDFTSPQMQENTARVYEAVLDHPCAALLKKTIARKHTSVDVASLYLPLSDSKNQATYIIACSVYETREESSHMNDRHMLDHQNIRHLQYIDLGSGTPKVIFDKPEANPNLHANSSSSEKRWWNRFSRKSGQSQNRRLDS